MNKERRQLDEDLIRRLAQAWGKEAQADLAMGTVSHMRDAYFDFQGRRERFEQIGGAAWDGVKQLAVASVRAQSTFFGVGVGVIGRESFGFESGPAKQFVEECGRAYQLLIEGKDPDGWLKNFLDQHDDFEEDLGGRPDWIPPREELVG